MLDLIVVSFNCSRPKVKATSPMVEGNMGKFESQLGLSGGEFLFERMCIFEELLQCFQNP